MSVLSPLCHLKPLSIMTLSMKILLGLCWVASSYAADFSALNQQYQQLSSKVYQQAVQSSVLPTINDLQALSQQVAALVERQEHYQAVALVVYNLNTVLDQVDRPEVFDLINLLLNQNEWNTALTIFEEIKLSGDELSISNASFQFAEYLIGREQWRESLSFINGIYSALPQNESFHALLLTGVALQNLKDHRQAVKFYEQIPKYSPYYNYAQLNTAIAYFRQGWWSDARLAINNVFDEKQRDLTDEYRNRLHLALGFLLMAHEYHRDARASFRKIQLDSYYADKAILGLSLAAVNQNDNIGALNALLRLQASDRQSLAVDESNLLLPYIYQRLDQQQTAQAGFAEAAQYFESRLNDLKQLDQKQYTLADIKSDSDRIFKAGQFELDLSEKAPAQFIENMALLLALKRNHQSVLSPAIDQLYSQHVAVLSDIIQELVDERAEYMRSYLSQARFGLARLYDESQPEPVLPEDAKPDAEPAAEASAEPSLDATSKDNLSEENPQDTLLIDPVEATDGAQTLDTDATLQSE